MNAYNRKQSRDDQSLNFLTPNPTPKSLIPASDPDPVLAKILNSYSDLTSLQQTEMACLMPRLHLAVLTTRNEI